MGGKKDKKKKGKDPLKKAALAAKKEAKADKAALKRMQKERDRLDSLSVHEGDRASGGAREDDAVAGGKRTKGKDKKKKGDAHQSDDLETLLESYRNRTIELASAEVEALDSPFPQPPRGNFTWTLVPSNSMLYMFGGEYYDGGENLVFDEMLRWDPDTRPGKADNDDDVDDEDGNNDYGAVNLGKWTRILTPAPTPPPRCAHTAVHHNDAIYIFGGEMATAEKYHHYKDMWKFEIRNNLWEECRPCGGTPPAARSGHRSVAWRHFMIVFGGFHEALRSETRWFNDVHLYDFQSGGWTEVRQGRLARAPPPRSACGLALCTSPSEALFVYGGYSKVKNANVPGASKAEGIVHVDSWMLPLKPLVGAGRGGGGALGGMSPPAWERVYRKGEYPSARAGVSSVMHKNKMWVFGGVTDNEKEHHKMESVFYDDLFALDMERRRWFMMRLKKTGVGSGRRRRRKDAAENNRNAAIDNEHGTKEVSDDDSSLGDDEGPTKNKEALSSGWGLDQLRHDMFAFIDGEGNIVYEKIEDGEKVAGSSDGQRMIKEERIQATQENSAETDSLGKIDGAGDKAVKVEQPHLNSSLVETAMSSAASGPIQKIEPSSVMKVDGKGLPAAVARQTPLPRINCAVVVRNNRLYVYGGVLEVGDREVTLDDCWSIDLNKRDKWTCIWPGQMHQQVWKGVDSDNDSYISSDQGGDGDGESDGDMAGFEPIVEDGQGDESEEAQKKTRKSGKKAKEKEKRRGVRHEIAELKEKLGVDNDQRTPLMGEVIADFYTRTTEYWNAEAVNSLGKLAIERGEALSSKELKREGFRLARERYEELRPILDRLNELEIAQADKDEKRARKKSDKKPKKDRLR